jgi:predicted aspartyl protease
MSDEKEPSNQQQLCAMTGNKQIYLVVKVQGRHLRSMIDSGATGNFMTAKIATEKGFPLQRKDKPYPLFAIDGQISSNGGMVTHQTIPLEMIMLRGHKE